MWIDNQQSLNLTLFCLKRSECCIYTVCKSQTNKKLFNYIFLIWSIKLGYDVKIILLFVKKDNFHWVREKLMRYRVKLRRLHGCVHVYAHELWNETRFTIWLFLTLFPFCLFCSWILSAYLDTPYDLSFSRNRIGARNSTEWTTVYYP